MKKVAELMPKIASNEFQMKAKRITYAQKQLLKHECVAAHFRFSLLSVYQSKLKIRKHNSFDTLHLVRHTANMSVCGCTYIVLQQCPFCIISCLITFHELDSFQAIKCASHVQKYPIACPRMHHTFAYSPICANIRFYAVHSFKTLYEM